MTKEDGEKSVGVSMVFYEEVQDINICHAIHTLQVSLTRETLYITTAQSFFKNGHTRPHFVLFSFFSYDKYSTNTINDKSVDGVLGTRTRAAGW